MNDHSTANIPPNAPPDPPKPGPLQRFAARASRFVGRHLHAPTLPLSAAPRPLLRLGSDYGAWSYLDDPSLAGCTAICCGLGEDGSFDMAFASRHGARVVIVDPTPRAIAHFEGLLSRLGQPALRLHVEGGRQPTDSYDLSSIAPGQVTMVRKALWIRTERLRFFAPPDPTHVSHSILNYQNSYRNDTPAIEVDATTIDHVLQEAEIGVPALMKIDIEGAEIEVVPDLLARGVRPQQLLIEYDELSVPSAKSRRRIEGCDAALRAAGYLLVHHDRPSNFLYTTLR